MDFSKNISNLDIQGIAVTSVKDNISEINGFQVRDISAYDKDSLVLISISDKNAVRDVAKSLYELGYKNQKTLNEMLSDK